MIYMDNAATTRTAQEVVDAMLPYFRENFGNPSAVYQAGNRARAALSTARNQAAALLHVRPETIYFTSGGSESDNWVLQDAFRRALLRGIPHPHLIVSSIEHHAVLNTCKSLGPLGARVTYLPVDSEGRISPENVERAIETDPDSTVLISVMTANNEVGTIQPIREIGRIAGSHGIPFHTDAVQAFGHIPLNLSELPVDFLSASAHKLYGPKGVGLLYIRENQKVQSLIHGGGQERNRRAGTENVPGIVGFGRACELAEQNMKKDAEQETALRNYMLQKLREEIPDISLNGSSENRLPNNLNIAFHGVKGESLLILLDMAGICASSGSACTAGSLDPSHVLLAMGQSPEQAREAVRFTFSNETTKEEIDQVVSVVRDSVERLRSIASN